jgi:hypothetical protein
MALLTMPSCLSGGGLSRLEAHYAGVKAGVQTLGCATKLILQMAVKNRRLANNNKLGDDGTATARLNFMRAAGREAVGRHPAADQAGAAAARRAGRRAMRVNLTRGSFRLWIVVTVL